MKTYNWIIYKFESPSGGVYIGKTSNLTKRVASYKGQLAKTQPRLGNSFKKHGFDNHTISVIDEFVGTNNYSCGKEMFWIRTYMSNCKKWPEQKGLNLTDGGKGTIGYKASEEHKKRLSEIHTGVPSGKKGIPMSEEAKKKVSEGLKKYYEKNPCARVGIKMTEEIKKKIAETKKSRVYPKRPKREITEEARIRLSNSRKGRPAHNKGKPMPPHQIELLRKINTGRPSWNKGLKSQLSNEDRKIKFGAHNLGHTRNRGKVHTKEFCELMSKARLGKPHSALYKPILQYSISGKLINEFDSIKSASQNIGLSCWTIGNIAKGLNKLPPPFIFKYKQA